MATLNIAILALCFTLSSMAVNGDETPTLVDAETPTLVDAENPTLIDTKTPTLVDAENPTLVDAKIPPVVDAKIPPVVEGVVEDNIVQAGGSEYTADVVPSPAAGVPAADVIPSFKAPPAQLLDAVGGVSLPELSPIEDAACYFIKHGWFDPKSAELDRAALWAAVTKLLPPPPAQLTPDTALPLMRRCISYFQPASLEELTKNCGGQCAELLGKVQGFEIDLFDMPKRCQGLIGGLVHVRDGGKVGAPNEVIRLCLRYFEEVVLDHVLSSLQ